MNEVFDPKELEVYLQTDETGHAYYNFLSLITGKIPNDFIIRLKYEVGMMKHAYARNFRFMCLDKDGTGVISCSESSLCFFGSKNYDFLGEIDSKLSRLGIKPRDLGYGKGYLFEDFEAIPFKTWSEFEKKYQELQQYSESMGLGHLIIKPKK